MYSLSDLSSSEDGEEIDSLWFYDPLKTKGKVWIHTLHVLLHISMTFPTILVRWQSSTRHF